MRRLVIIVVGLWLVAGVMGWLVLWRGRERDATGFKKTGVAFVQKHCVECHGPEKQKKKLALHLFLNDSDVLKQRDIWELVMQKVEFGEMPPSGDLRPTTAERAAFLASVKAVFDKADRTAPPDPGRVVVRRLNRTEYNNTIRDLLGVDFQPAADFPADDIGYGFDNIGEVLTLPPVLMERYLDAAEKIAQRLFATPKAKERFLDCAPAKPQREQTREIIERFLTRAWRRPASSDEVERLAKVVDSTVAKDGTWETGLQVAVQAVLVSPKFLFRLEAEAQPAPRGVHPLDEFQLATRLSYFLWSTMPDEELFEQARQHKLAANLETQVRRMLRDPKAQSLVTDFGMQWLQLRRLAVVAPDGKQFPQFDDKLRAAMRQETELFLGAILREDRSVLDLLDADFTFLNEPLAKLYNIADTKGNRTGQDAAPGQKGEPIRGETFQRVALNDHRRGGVLTQASVLTVTSNPTRTSPVKRGRYVLEQILGMPQPPPPGDVPPLAEGEQAEAAASLRHRLEKHRDNALCASCHARLDPPGFGLENFDAIGAWRTKDGKFAVDAGGVMLDGTTFDGPVELKAVLKEKQNLFVRCLTEKLLTYALGRGLETCDRRAVNRITESLARDQYRFSTLIVGITNSEPFRLHRGSD